VQDFAWALIPIAAIASACVIAVISIVSRTRVRELEIRERIAMIERGLVPAPEVDPRGFDRAMERLDRGISRPRRQPVERNRGAGIALIGIGCGLVVLFTFANDSPRVGFGIGGFLIFLGLSFVVNSLVQRQQNWPASPYPSGPVAAPSGSGPGEMPEATPPGDRR
jgi:hypothetical protein